MTKKKLLGIILLLNLNLLNANITSYVDCFIGTDFHGHTFPGACLPFGAVQASPDADGAKWDWSSGYHYSDTNIKGFSQTHLSGTGCPELGDFLLIPTNGELKLFPGEKSNPDEGYRSTFSHEQEWASPGYYAVMLEDYGIKAEMTVTNRTAFYRFTYPKDDDSRLILDLAHFLGNAPHDVKICNIRFLDDELVVGSHTTNYWANNRTVYFAMKFDKKPISKTIYNNDKPFTAPSERAFSLIRNASAQHLKAVFDFDFKNGGELLVKIAVSSVSYQNALENLEKENSEWDFNDVKKSADKTWEENLSKISVKSDNVTKRIFTTALYHCMISPMLNQDVNGEFRGYDNLVYTNKKFENYSVFSLWDTFRALHPLFTIIEQERTKSFINSFIDAFKQSPYKMLPIWPLPQNESFSMIGYNSVPVLVDAYSKNLLNEFDAKELLDACVTTASNQEWRGLKTYQERGFVPVEDSDESVCSALEYAYSDWCISYFAKQIGNEDIAQKFLKRSQNFRNHFDEKTKFFRTKHSDGKFQEPFDPQRTHTREGSKERDYTEGNAWQWRWFAPHAPYDLIEMLGKKEQFTKELDTLFSMERTDFNVADVTGTIGEYAHGNEPSHHVIYFYAFVGQAHKTQRLARQIMSTFYTDRADGICGNEDCGQMSAWYVFSAMGFYPFNPCGGIYVLGSPILEEATINLESGKTFKVVAKNQSEKNVYVKEVKLNGERLLRPYITHSEIVSGGLLEFEMSPTPNENCFDKNIVIPVAQ